MVQPVAFRYNEETAKNNFYQKELGSLAGDEIQMRALKEFNEFVVKLEQNGVHVHVIRDTISSDTPDSIFPNNWVSFHQDGRVALYPMFAKNRRMERRPAILDNLRSKNFNISSVVDFSMYESEDVFLEGTGSMILDRDHRICYAALSIRTDKEIALKFCSEFDYELVSFNANQTHDGERLPIYHTNVMMCVADEYVVICMDAIDDLAEQKMLIDCFEKTNKEIIEISEEQKQEFAGNMLQVRGNEPYLVMSTSAFKSLNEEQLKKIEKFNPIIHSELDTIQACGGGSARCMMAEVFLPLNS
jgi:hypothetical protein